MSIIIVNVYASNIGAPQYIRQTLMAESDSAWKPEIKLIYWLIPTTASQVSSLRIIIFSSSWLISLKLKLVLWHPRIIFQLSLQRII